MKNWLSWFDVLLMAILAGIFMPSAMAANSLDVDTFESLFSSNTKAFIEHVDKLSAEPALGWSAQDKITLAFYVGRAAILRSDYAVAESSLLKVLNLSEDLTLKYRAVVSLVNLHQHTGNFYQAFSYGLQFSDEQFVEVADEVKASGLMAMALALMDSGLYDESANLVRKIQLEKVSARVRCAALYLTSQIAYKSSVFVKPLEQIKTDNEQCFVENQMLYALLTDSAISIIYLNQHQPELALDLLQTKNAAVSQLGYDNLTLMWLAIRASAYATHQNKTAAKDSAKQLENSLHSKAMENSLEVALLAYQGLAASYKLLGDQQKVVQYLELYQHTYQKANNRQMTAALAYYAALMQAAQRKQEISLLNQQTRQLQLENDLAMAESVNNRLYLLVAVTLLLLLVTVLYRTHRSGIKLKERVTFDKLTKVFSRDHFEDLLASSLNQAQSQQQKLGFVLFDLDHFKQVNDNYGHQTGDWVLQQAATAAQQCLRKSDALGRIGGEEFAILLQDCDLDMSRALAESVRQAIEDIDTALIGHSFNVTASLGVSTAQDCGYSARKLFSSADEALYQAKQRGRNKVMPEV
ncbi:GGDEF domain-containing protein [Rheinheimera sediminis]|uniref:GGDEF domain-containing protein n=1 Tax=Rheinheimera sp. YQF-1 TaxID=2499626 RepID=UPI000FD913EA|nr:GGDEF domain-containing protein [Rheinheimera sp. YQF-1]RVT45587.1 GGDEF domain-containing protein [Rheinheimera sp. YQF-1]